MCRGHIPTTYSHLRRKTLMVTLSPTPSPHPLLPFTPALLTVWDDLYLPVSGGLCPRAARSTTAGGLSSLTKALALSLCKVHPGCSVHP